MPIGTFRRYPGKALLLRHSKWTAAKWMFRLGQEKLKRQRRHRPGMFLLKSDNGEFVGSIDESNHIIRTVVQSGNARAWSSRETAVAAAESIPGLNFWLFRHDGEPVAA